MISVASIRLQQVEMVSMSDVSGQYGVPQRSVSDFSVSNSLCTRRILQKSDLGLYVPP
jgi:hypothetical protein